MFSLRIQDNQSNGKTFSECISDVVLSEDDSKKVYSDLSNIANIKLSELSKKNPALLLFPKDFENIKDDIDDLLVCTLSGSLEKSSEAKVVTGNLMGFIGYGNTQLSINSRFSNGGEDFFLHYMLQKVFASHVVNMFHSSGRDDVFDFLMYLFPGMLHKALTQGVYKTYEVHRKNDANVKGMIDVPRHIANNIPFAGKIAYTTRERTTDNSVTELIRHTIECIKKKPNGKVFLSSNPDVKSDVQTIVNVTGLYNPYDREKILRKNSKPLNHPYFTDYKPLQKLCVAILMHQKLKYKDDANQVYGILFDGSWLWEEYLWCLLKDKEFQHPRNKERSGRICMFENSKDENEDFEKNHRKIYPDYYKTGIILDAKYKRLEKGVGREDMYQIVSYMHTMSFPYGGFIHPKECELIAIKKESLCKTYKLAGLGGNVSVISFLVPKKNGGQKYENMSEFSKEMVESEEKFLSQIETLNK